MDDFIRFHNAAGKVVVAKKVWTHHYPCRSLRAPTPETVLRRPNGGTDPGRPSCPLVPTTPPNSPPGKCFSGRGLGVREALDPRWRSVPLGVIDDRCTGGPAGGGLSI